MPVIIPPLQSYSSVIRDWWNRPQRKGTRSHPGYITDKKSRKRI